MVDTSELESFLNEKSAKENDVCEIIGEGVLETKKDTISNREYKVLNLPVSLNGKQVIWTPNKDAIKVLQAKYGTDTANWKYKKFQVKFYPKTAFGQTRTAILPVLLEM